MYVCMYVCLYVCKFKNMYVFSLYLCPTLNKCTFMIVHACMYVRNSQDSLFMYVCMYVGVLDTC